MLGILKLKKGVTLVELLAVIVILGIIAAIAIPTVGNLISNTQNKASEATHSSVLEAARLYYIETEATSFTLALVITAGYISGVSYEDIDGDPVLNTAVTFSVTGGVVSVTAPAALYIKGHQVHPSS